MKTRPELRNPRISVILPLYNHEKYIRGAIDSVLAQTVTDFEIIIIDDGSRDHSGKIVKSISDDRIVYVHQDNQGPQHTINRGLTMAKGTYISILNSDDLYQPRRFEECLEVMESQPSVAAVFSHVEIIDEAGRHIRYHSRQDGWANHHPETSFKGENHIILDLLVGNFLISTSNLFCRTKVFDQLGYFSNYRYAHDYEFFLRLCYHREVEIIQKPLLKYRVHADNTIGENEPAHYFEIGLILSNFFSNYDLRHIFPTDDVDKLLARFFHCVRLCGSERMMMTLILFALKYHYCEMTVRLIDHEDSAFREMCLDFFRRQIEKSEAFDAERHKYEELTDLLMTTETKLASTEEACRRLKQKLAESKRQIAHTQQQIKAFRRISTHLLSKLSKAPEEDARRSNALQEPGAEV